jgi:nuclear protein localization family protein 4
MIVRVRTRDGTERITVPSSDITVAKLKEILETELKVPKDEQILSTSLDVLTSKTPEEFKDMANGRAKIASCGIDTNGAVVHLMYGCEREPTKTTVAVRDAARGLTGRKMTVDDMIAAQVRIERQEAPHCVSVSFDANAANVFQSYVNYTLGFKQVRFGWLYGARDDDGKTRVDAIYEPEQEGTEEDVEVLEDTLEDEKADALAGALGMIRVGCIISTPKDERDFTLSAREVSRVARLQSKFGKEFVTAVVSTFEDEDDNWQVSFEAFQLSDAAMKVQERGWFTGECGVDEDGDELKGVSKLTNEVIVRDGPSINDVNAVDNDMFLVTVPILDHEGAISTTFPVENRLHPVQTVDDLKDALRKDKPYGERLRDFHLLLFLAKHIDINELAVIASAVHHGEDVPEGYTLLIDCLAGLA